MSSSITIKHGAEGNDEIIWESDFIKRSAKTQNSVREWQHAEWRIYLRNHSK